MAVLIDTNVLLRGLQPNNPSLFIAQGAIDSLRESGEAMSVSVQNIIELGAERAAREIAGFKKLFRVLPESAQILPEWERLVSSYRVSGKNAHDARLVAAMNVNRVDKILTFNTANFMRFQDIQVLDPRQAR